MMFYAEDPARRTRQMTWDAVVGIWCLLWVLAGRAVYDTIMLLQGPIRNVNSAVSGLTDGLDRFTRSLPSFLQGPTNSLGDETAALRDATGSQLEVIADIAMAVGVATAAGPILLALAIAGLIRARWAREAQAAQQLRTLPNFNELMAKRALVNCSLRELAAASPDPVGDLTTGRFDSLAQLEIRRVGLRADRQLPSPPS